ncbi:hypothetical protein OS493_020278 [Desmophyllum pertusum]|uniref:Uncharacterized protein n=1 Tax=Desmophyllum pertusum TaxID=174260 RepID=A0A9W9ZNN2_9CNID|nr:hypothetical protein OS493_020278 [Desmophyllum pertusum]
MKAALVAILLLVAITTICARYADRPDDEFETRVTVIDDKFRPATFMEYLQKLGNARHSGSTINAKKY